MEKQYVLAFDAGTTSSRAIVFDRTGKICSIAQKEFTQIFPHSGWVEHDPHEIWSSQAAVAAEAITKIGINGKNIAGIGITNQRETTIVWDRNTGEPIYNAIVWQDRRTADYCNKLKDEGYLSTIKEKTGLMIDAYFSATKVKWILDNVEGARKKAQDGELAFGTVDTWLVWQLTRGEMHITDASNASRTMLYNINTLDWDDDLLQLFDIPKNMMPQVRQSSEVYGYTKTTIFASKVPIAGIAGDQQSALFGQMCIDKGMVKNTYGTGCFILMNTGEKPVVSKNNLISTIAWQLKGETTYALEGSIFMGGAIVQWLRDGLKIINSSDEVETLASQVSNNGDVYFVPALTGLGAPYWDQYARGTIVGISRGTNNAHIARAALEAIAFQSMDVINAMILDAGVGLKELRVDGGASKNNLLMQFQADVLGQSVLRPKTIETTALGAAYLAGLAVGYWNSVDEIQKHWQVDSTFDPDNSADMQLVKRKWSDAVYRSRSWIK